MCGINFILDKPEVIDISVLQKMNEALIHRGPDHQDSTVIETKSDRILFGSTRLKVCDLHDRANQPFTSDDGRYTLIYNGEIYNHVDLRNDLISSGCVFRTSSDTEVLLTMLIRKGANALNLLEGMFAFCFFDSQKNEILFARDKTGIKPLYYFYNTHYFVASSEIKGILASGIPNKELNPDSVGYYLDFGFAPKPQTFFKNIVEVPEGHYLTIDSNRAVEVINYSLPIEPSYVSEDENKILLNVENLLVDALHTHLTSEVPLSLFLSGGVDSTLLLALNQKYGIKDLPSYSINNDSNTYGTKDHLFAAKAAKQYGSTHHEVMASPDVMYELDDYIDQLDQPVGDSGALLTLLLSKAACKTSKIVISGAGADELFAGYNRHWAYNKYLKYYTVFGKHSDILKTLFKGLPTGLPHPMRKQFQLIKKFSSKINSDPKATFLNFTKKTSVNSSHKIAVDFNLSQSLNWALDYDRSNYLISDVLAISDRSSMQESLELRVPYLDQKLSNYIRSLSGTYLLKNGQKWILKRILSSLGGEQYAQRNKEGLGIPLGAWIRDNKAPQFERLFQNKNSLIFKFISNDIAMELLESQKKGNGDHSQQLWSLLVLGLWLEKNFT